MMQMMISAEEKQALTNALARLAHKFIDQRNEEHKQVIELFREVLDQQRDITDQQHKMIEELKEQS
jgi:predicted nucleotide-binding protein (sugar kinase/HSP70/actin superfamily)